MKILRVTIPAIFVSVVAFAPPPPPPTPRYYPAPNAPIAGEPLLGAIEGALAAGTPQPTLKLPTPDGARLVSSDEFFAALKTALAGDAAHTAGIVRAVARVARISDGTANGKPVAPTDDDLFAAVAQTAAALPHIGEALDALSAEFSADTVALTSSALRAAALGGATDADLRGIAHVGARALADAFDPADAPYRDLAFQAVGTITADIPGTGNAALAKGVVTGLIRGARDAGLETIFLDDIARGSANALAVTSGVALDDLANAAFVEAATSRRHAVLVAAGLALGVPFDQASAASAQTVASAGGSAAPTFAAAIAAAAAHAQTIRDTAVNLAGVATRSRITADGNAESAALVCAALMARPDEAGEILRAGFEGTYDTGVTPPAGTFLDWLRVALAGSPKSAPEALGRALAVGQANGLFTNGIQPGDAAAVVLASAAPLSPAPFMKAAAKLVKTGANPELAPAAGKLTAVLASGPRPYDAAAVIAPLFKVAPASKETILTAALLGVSDRNVRAAIAGAAVIADPANLVHNTMVALAADADTADDAAIRAGITAAEGVAMISAGPPRKIAAKMHSIFSTYPGETTAAVAGALAGTPQRALPILATALAADPAFTREGALALDPADAAALTLAARIAANEAMNATVPGTTLAELFDLVENAVLAHRADVGGIVTAAVIASPRYAHHTLHAAVFRSAGVASKAVQSAFDGIAIGAPGDAAARCAALSAGMVNGIREARAGAKESEQIRLAVDAAVKAAKQVPNGTAGVVTGIVSQFVKPGDTTLAAVVALTAATTTSPADAPAIAQAAAQAAVSVSGVSTFDLGLIVNAVAAAGPPFSPDQIRAAARLGKTKALAHKPGAGAAGVLDYQHHSGTTDPLPSLSGL